MLSESFNSTSRTPDQPHLNDEIPPVIRTQLNADMDRELIVRMQDLARKRRRLQPDITDDEMADYLALAENFQNVAHWGTARHSTFQGSIRAGTGWAMAIAIVLGVLTAVLIAAIAITV